MLDPINRPRLHPLLGTAAVAVILTCAVGVYAMFRITAPKAALTPLSLVATATTPTAIAGTTASMVSAPRPASQGAPIAPASAVQAASAATAPMASSPPVVTHAHPHLPTHVVHRRTTPSPVVRPAPEDPALYDNIPGYSGTSADAALCPSCGTVVALQAIDVGQPTTGAGGLGGAALGGLVGHRFGRGRGRTAMTVLGVLGGAMAGNAVEHGLNRQVVYRMVVRFENGASQTFTQDQPFPFGEGEGVRMVNGVLYRR